MVAASATCINMGAIAHEVLDGCHGRTSPVAWDGETVDLYHYVATAEYPYTVGCYRGTPTAPR